MDSGTTDSGTGDCGERCGRKVEKRSNAFQIVVETAGGGRGLLIKCSGVLLVSCDSRRQKGARYVEKNGQMADMTNHSQGSRLKTRWEEKTSTGLI